MQERKIKTPLGDVNVKFDRQYVRFETAENLGVYGPRSGDCAQFVVGKYSFHARIDIISDEAGLHLRRGWRHRVPLGDPKAFNFILTHRPGRGDGHHEYHAPESARRAVLGQVVPALVSFLGSIKAERAMDEVAALRREAEANDRWADGYRKKSEDFRAKADALEKANAWAVEQVAEVRGA